MLTEARKTIQARWRNKNRDKIKMYNIIHHEKRRQQIFIGKKCLVCEILLSSDIGAHGTYKYCRSCRNKGLAEKHSRQLRNKRYTYKQKSEYNIRGERIN